MIRVPQAFHSSCVFSFSSCQLFPWAPSSNLSFDLHEAISSSYATPFFPPAWQWVVWPLHKEKTRWKPVKKRALSSHVPASPTALSSDFISGTRLTGFTFLGPVSPIVYYHLLFRAPIFIFFPSSLCLFIPGLFLSCEPECYRLHIDRPFSLRFLLIPPSPPRAHHLYSFLFPSLVWPWLKSAYDFETEEIKQGPQRINGKDQTTRLLFLFLFLFFCFFFCFCFCGINITSMH